MNLGGVVHYQFTTKNGTYHLPFPADPLHLILLPRDSRHAKKYRCQCNKCLSVSSSQNLKSGFTTWILLDNSLFTRVAKCDHKAPSCYPTGSRESQSCLPQKENWFIRNSRQKRQPNSDFVIMFMILGSSQASQIERLNGQTSAPLRRVIYTHQSYTTNSL
jgi:hypothetical protein